MTNDMNTLPNTLEMKEVKEISLAYKDCFDNFPFFFSNCSQWCYKNISHSGVRDIDPKPQVIQSFSSPSSRYLFLRNPEIPSNVLVIVTMKYMFVK